MIIETIIFIAIFLTSLIISLWEFIRSVKMDIGWSKSIFIIGLFIIIVIISIMLFKLKVFN